MIVIIVRHRCTRGVGEALRRRLRLDNKAWTRAFGIRIISSYEDIGDQVDLLHVSSSSCPIHVSVRNYLAKVFIIRLK